MTSRLEQLATDRSDRMTAHIRQLTLALHTRILACVRLGLPLEGDPMRDALSTAIVYLELERERQRELVELSRRIDGVLPDVVAAGDEAPPVDEVSVERASTCGACGEPLEVPVVARVEVG